MRRTIFTLAAVCLAACASYSDTTKSVQLASDVHRISMNGTAFNDQSDSFDYAMLKAAEVTIDSGKRYFTVENAADTTTSSTYVAPSTFNSSTTTTANATVFGNQAYGNAYSNTSGTYNQGQTYNFVKPGIDVMIRTHDEIPQGRWFDAQDIAKYMGPRLNPERWGEK